MPVAIHAIDAPERIARYPEPYASRVDGRRKFPLGDIFGLNNFGVNLSRLSPGATSSMRHAHAKQDEFIYVLQGRPTLHTDDGYTELAPGMCAGFKAGTGNGHRLLNNTAEEAVYIEVGDRTPETKAIIRTMMYAHSILMVAGSSLQGRYANLRSRMRPNLSFQPTHSGLRPPWAAELYR